MCSDWEELQQDGYPSPNGPAKETELKVQRTCWKCLNQPDTNTFVTSSQEMKPFGDILLWHLWQAVRQSNMGDCWQEETFCASTRFPESEATVFQSVVFQSWKQLFSKVLFLNTQYPVRVNILDLYRRSLHSVQHCAHWKGLLAYSVKYVSVNVCVETVLQCPQSQSHCDLPK